MMPPCQYLLTEWKHLTLESTVKKKTCATQIRIEEINLVE